MYKKVNGIEVPLTDTEIADFNAREADFNSPASQYQIALNQCYAQRLGEYPPVQDIVITLMDTIKDNRQAFPASSSIDAIIAEQAAVKTKYPKPEDVVIDTPVDIKPGK